MCGGVSGEAGSTQADTCSFQGQGFVERGPRAFQGPPLKDTDWPIAGNGFSCDRMASLQSMTGVCVALCALAAAVTATDDRDLVTTLTLGPAGATSTVSLFVLPGMSLRPARPVLCFPSFVRLSLTLPRSEPLTLISWRSPPSGLCDLPWCSPTQHLFSAMGKLNF